MLPLALDLEVTPIGTLPAALGGVLVYVVLTGGLALLAAIALWRRAVAKALRREAERATREGRANDPLRPGRVVLSGHWLPERANEPPPMRVAITQAGRERKRKNGWYVKWSETSREVEARPFVLREHRGRDVQIEPGNAPYFADGLDDGRPVSVNQRVRTARLMPHEEVFVAGELELPGGRPRDGLYRAAAGVTPVLRAPRGARLVVWTEPIASHLARRQRFYASWAASAGVALGIATLCLLPYHARRFAGRAATATIKSHEYWTTTSKGNTYPHYGLAMHVGDGRVAPRDWTDEVSREDAHALHDGDQLPAIVVGDGGAFPALGTRAAPSGMTTFILIICGVFFAFLYVANRPRAWYERRRVVDRVPGRLAG